MAMDEDALCRGKKKYISELYDKKKTIEKN